MIIWLAAGSVALSPAFLLLGYMRDRELVINKRRRIARIFFWLSMVAFFGWLAEFALILTREHLPFVARLAWCGAHLAWMAAMVLTLSTSGRWPYRNWHCFPEQ